MPGPEGLCRRSITSVETGLPLALGLKHERIARSQTANRSFSDFLIWLRSQIEEAS